MVVMEAAHSLEPLVTDVLSIVRECNDRKTCEGLTGERMSRDWLLTAAQFDNSGENLELVHPFTPASRLSLYFYISSIFFLPNSHCSSLFSIVSSLQVILPLHPFFAVITPQPLEWRVAIATSLPFLCGLAEVEQLSVIKSHTSAQLHTHPVCVVMTTNSRISWGDQCKWIFYFRDVSL